MRPGSNWAGNIHYSADELVAPRTIPELQERVAGATRVRALGSRHSFNDIADSSGLMVSLGGLTGDVVIDATSRTVTFPAGMRYGDLAEVLERAGWALSNLASLPHISVAGAVATATHGSGDTNPSLSSAVVALKLVTADGGVVSFDRGHPDFSGAVVAIGALGIVFELTLEIEPRFTMRQDLYRGISIDTVIDSFDEISSAGYSVSVNPDWEEPADGRLRVKSRSDHAPDSVAGAARVVREDVVPEGATDRTGERGPWLDRLPHFQLAFQPSFGNELQSEYLVPREAIGPALAALRPLAPRFAALTHGVELRTIRRDELWLSPAYQRDCVGIHFTWLLQDAAVRRLLPAIEDALAPFDARPHWGKISAGLRGSSPRLSDFLHLRERLDPARTFVNDFSALALGLETQRRR